MGNPSAIRGEREQQASGVSDHQELVLQQTDTCGISDSGREHILVAEDDPILRRVLKVWLTNWGYSVISAEDGLKAWELVQQKQHCHLLILDWDMPGLVGPDLCHRIRAQMTHYHHYILLLTSRDSSRDVVIGLEAGADDYVAKPFDTNELKARVNAGRRIITLQDELLRVQEELRYESAHDPLTGSWSRAAILELFNKERMRSARSGVCTGVLMLDLDHFKRVNDSYGHMTGDAVLVEAVERISRVIRSYDYIGRYGGEEFLVVLPQSTPVHIFEHAERIRRAIADSPFVIGGDQIPITVSIGAAIASPDMDSSSVLYSADVALYRAKDSGRNQCVVSQDAVPIGIQLQE